MKENFIIHLVRHDNDGYSLSKVNEQFKLDLLKVFGGFTILQCKGVWADDSGTVFSDDIERIIISTREDQLSLHGKLAMLTMYAKNAKQKCVYAVIDGETYFVEPITFTALYDLGSKTDDLQPATN